MLNPSSAKAIAALVILVGCQVCCGQPQGGANSHIARELNFTTGAVVAAKFGVHEIALSGDGTVSNPFDTIATVKFVPPSGEKNAKRVHAFYDGDNTWRARVYASEVGDWTWSSACSTDAGLHGKSGIFRCQDSKLRGRLLPHTNNSRQWMTEDGRWFLNVVDTAYFLLSAKDELGNPIPEEDFQAYVRDAVDHGITAFMAYGVPRPRSYNEEGSWQENYFADSSYSTFRLENFRVSDQRLRWMLDHYPDTAVEFIMFPRGARYAADQTFWKNLTPQQRERILRYMVARFAAYPQIYWQVSNDTHYGPKHPNNNAFVREVGAYLQQCDQWQHPRSTGHARWVDFYFGEEDWATFLHLENNHELGAAEYAKYAHLAKPVLLGEDRYEYYNPAKDPLDMRYYQRRLFWAWLFSGGSANYGGCWWVLYPYSQIAQRTLPVNPYLSSSAGEAGLNAGQSKLKSTTAKMALTGLDSVRFIRDYFESRRIELSDFEPDHALVNDSAVTEAVRVPKLMRRGQEEYLVYHPNAAADGREAVVDSLRTPQFRLDLRNANGRYAVEWYRVEDGQTQPGNDVAGGGQRELTAPWAGADVVLRLLRR